MKRKWIFTIIAVFSLILVSCNFNSCAPEPPVAEPMEYTYEYENINMSNMPQTASATVIADNMVSIVSKFTQFKTDAGLMSAEAEIDAELPTETVEVSLSVIDQLAPNKFVIQAAFKTAIPVQINTISMVIYYDKNAITFDDTVTINKHFYQHQLDPDLDSIGNTVYNGDAGYPPPDGDLKSLRYSWFALDPDLRFDDEYVLLLIAEIHEPTKLAFSDIHGWLEFTDWYAQPYPLKVQNIKFLKVEVTE